MNTIRFSDATRSRVPVRGGELAYARVGSGPHLVLVHGWPLHSATWRHLVPRLAEHATLHLFDLPGCGETTWSGELSFRASARALAEGIASLGLERYAILGHDSGGAIARHVAADDRRAEKLVLVDTELAGSQSALLFALMTLCRLPFATQLFPWLLRRRVFRHSILGFGSCFTDPNYAETDFREWFVAPLTTDTRVVANQLALGRSLDTAYIDELADTERRIRAQTLCIWGEKDPYFPVETARGIVRRLPAGTRFETIPGARLFPHEDHPDEVAALVRAFLAEPLARDRDAPAHATPSVS